MKQLFHSTNDNYQISNDWLSGARNSLSPKINRQSKFTASFLSTPAAEQKWLVNFLPDNDHSP
jgi:hypothetical protein